MTCLQVKVEAGQGAVVFGVCWAAAWGSRVVLR